jgi:hypothetical protein
MITSTEARMFEQLGYEDSGLTYIDLFNQHYGLKVLTIKVECPVCHHTWGIKIENYNKSSDIPERKFICDYCK